MAIAVFLSTTLRHHVSGYNPAIGLSLELEGRPSARRLAQSLGLPLEEIKIVMLNGRRVSLEQTVRDGDRLSFFPAVGGG